MEGLVLSDLKNIERISETLNADYHKMQHFITESNWEARDVMDQIAKHIPDGHKLHANDHRVPE